MAAWHHDPLPGLEQIDRSREQQNRFRGPPMRGRR